MKRKIFSMIFISLCMGFASCGEELKPEDFGNKTEDVIDDDGVPSGIPGNESMFGIYSCLGTNSDVWKNFKEDAELNVTLHKGDNSSWSSYFNLYAIWIVDEKTIYWVDDYISFSQSRPTSDENSILLESEPFTVTYSKAIVGRWQQYTDTYYLTHYVYKWQSRDRWEGRYAMNGSKITVHTDETTKWENGRQVVAVDYNTLTWDYSDGTIDIDGTKYRKIN